ncbi:MAG: hypothetical protein HY820_29800 [Acidobacteria bacterium]|nr:hypothetical protein [Acidobacteriota bacterium]
MRIWLTAFGAVAVLVFAGLTFWLWPQRLQLSPVKPPATFVSLSANGAAVRLPGQTLIADLATFDDELFAYLMFGHLRNLVARDGRRAWLTYEREGKAITYVIRLGLHDDFLTALPYLFRLQVVTRITQVSYRWVIPEVISRYEAQSQVFDTAYNLPARKKLETVPRAELVAYIRRFIRFKAATDGRIRRGIEPIPHPPSRPEAQRLAEDIITVADFFSLPLDFFLGIGAMENNYMNAKGDLGNAVWKRRAEKGDVILKRGRKGVLVLNESSGIWQITRETLRYAHRLSLAQKRDYSALPEHLRPPKDLDLNDVPPGVLTTYAGLFFRDLLDRFRGDVATAVGAYNGGPGNPNLQYEAGVRTAAEHARRVLEHAATLQGRPAAGMRFLTSAR